MVQSITHLTSEWHHKSTAMLLNCDTTTSQSPLHQYFTLLTLHSAYKKQPSQGSVISGKPLFPYPLANGSAVASFMGEIVSMSLPLSTTFCSSHVLLNRIHHWVSMLDSLSSCIVHDHTFPSSPAFTLKSINVSPYGWAPHEFSQWNFSVLSHGRRWPTPFSAQELQVVSAQVLPPPHHQRNIGLLGWSHSQCSPPYQRAEH